MDYICQMSQILLEYYLFFLYFSIFQIISVKGSQIMKEILKYNQQIIIIRCNLIRSFKFEYQLIYIPFSYGILFYKYIIIYNLLYFQMTELSSHFPNNFPVIDQCNTSATIKSSQSSIQSLIHNQLVEQNINQCKKLIQSNTMLNTNISKLNNNLQKLISKMVLNFEPNESSSRKSTKNNITDKKFKEGNDTVNQNKKQYYNKKQFECLNQIKDLVLSQDRSQRMEKRESLNQTNRSVILSHNFSMSKINQQRKQLQQEKQYSLGLEKKNTLLISNIKNPQSDNAKNIDYKYRFINVPMVYQNQSEFSLQKWTARLYDTLNKETFYGFYKGMMDERQMKGFFCQNLIFNLLHLLKFCDEKTKSGIINEFERVSLKVLEYEKTKYPQKNKIYLNETMNKLIKQVQKHEDPKYNILDNLGISFEYNEKGNYKKLIKKTINNLMKVVNENYHEFQMNIKKIFQIKNQNNITIVIKNQIGQKINQNIPQFQQQNDEIIIPNSEILRVFIKWIEHLMEKVQKPSNFIEYRYYPFTSKKTFEQIYLDRETESQVIKDFESNFPKMQIDRKEFEAIKNQLIDKIEQNITHFHHIEQKQIQVGLAANILSQELTKTVVNQLNQRIHKILLFQQKIQNSFHKINYIGFNVYDLMRAKCIGTFEEIKKVYQNLLILEKKHILTIIRIKNRLKSGTRDYLINFIYKDTPIICQLQLAFEFRKQQIKQIKTGKFNHFLYELQRSIYGPIAQTAYIIFQGFENYSGLSNQIMNQKKKKEKIEKFIKRRRKFNLSNLVDDFKYVCKKCQSFNQCCPQCILNYIELGLSSMQDKKNFILGKQFEQFFQCNKKFDQDCWKFYILSDLYHSKLVIGYHNFFIKVEHILQKKYKIKNLKNIKVSKKIKYIFKIWDDYQPRQLAQFQKSLLHNLQQFLTKYNKLCTIGNVQLFLYEHNITLHNAQSQQFSQSNQKNQFTKNSEANQQLIKNSYLVIQLRDKMRIASYLCTFIKQKVRNTKSDPIGTIMSFIRQELIFIVQQYTEKEKLENLIDRKSKLLKYQNWYINVKHKYDTLINFNKILNLDLSSNNLQNIDFLHKMQDSKHNLRELIDLRLNNNRISQLVVKLKSIEHLEAASNNMTKINIKQLTQLKYLIVKHNRLEEIDFENNINIQYLDIGQNCIKQFRVVQTLKYLDISNNLIKEIEITQGLYYLNAENEKISPTIKILPQKQKKYKIQKIKYVGLNLKYNNIFILEAYKNLERVNFVKIFCETIFIDQSLARLKQLIISDSECKQIQIVNNPSIQKINLVNLILKDIIKCKNLGELKTLEIITYQNLNKSATIEVSENIKLQKLQVKTTYNDPNNNLPYSLILSQQDTLMPPNGKKKVRFQKLNNLTEIKLDFSQLTEVEISNIKQLKLINFTKVKSQLNYSHIKNIKQLQFYNCQLVFNKSLTSTINLLVSNLISPLTKRIRLSGLLQKIVLNGQVPNFINEVNFTYEKCLKQLILIKKQSILNFIDCSLKQIQSLRIEEVVLRDLDLSQLKVKNLTIKNSTIETMKLHEAIQVAHFQKNLIYNFDISNLISLKSLKLLYNDFSQVKLSNYPLLEQYEHKFEQKYTDNSQQQKTIYNITIEDLKSSDFAHSKQYKDQVFMEI